MAKQLSKCTKSVTNLITWDTLLENANKIIEEKAGVKLDIQYLGWGDYDKKMNVIISSGESYDIAFANNYVINAQKRRLR